MCCNTDAESCVCVCVRGVKTVAMELTYPNRFTPTLLVHISSWETSFCGGEDNKAEEKIVRSYEFMDSYRVENASAAL